VTTRRNVVPLVSAAREDCLIPMWDMCNHRAGRVTTEYDASLRRVECAAQSDVPTGQQVCVCCVRREMCECAHRYPYTTASDRWRTWCGSTDSCRSLQVRGVCVLVICRCVRIHIACQTTSTTSCRSTCSQCPTTPTMRRDWRC
jgi:hypothetical protein